MKKIFIFLITSFVLLLVFVSDHPQAVVSGGTGKLILSPPSSTLAVGVDTDVNVLLFTNNIPISSVAMRITFPAINNDLEVVSIVPSTELLAAGWSFPVKTATTLDSVTTIDVAGLNVGLTGYQNASNLPMLTLKLKANSNFTGKTLSFDTTQTKMLKKVDSSDMLGTPINGSYSAGGGGGITNTPTSTSTPTRTPTQTNTPTHTSTPTRTPTATVYHSPTPTVTPGGPSLTPSRTPTATHTPLPTATPNVNFSPTPTQEASFIPGDINRDGSVDALDYVILFENFTPQPITDILADINEDGMVNALDYVLFVENFGRTSL